MKKADDLGSNPSLRILKMKKLVEIAEEAEGEYQLPFKPAERIKRHPAPAHEELGCVNCIDWAMPVGTPILAARDGTVEETESRFNVHGGQEFVDKTNYIVLEHDNNESSVYVHLKWRGLKVKRGQEGKSRTNNRL